MLSRMYSYLSSWAKSFTGDDDAADDTPLPGPAIRVDTSRPANRQRQAPPAPRNLAELEQRIHLLDRIDQSNR